MPLADPLLDLLAAAALFRRQPADAVPGRRRVQVLVPNTLALLAIAAGAAACCWSASTRMRLE